MNPLNTTVWKTNQYSQKLVIEIVPSRISMQPLTAQGLVGAIALKKGFLKRLPVHAIERL